jgi:signal transduction histidine kinase
VHAARPRPSLALRVFAVFALAFFFEAPAAASELVVRDGFTQRAAGRLVDVHLDAAGDATFDAVVAQPSSAWAASDADVPNLGYRRGALWVRLRVRDERAQPAALVLDVRYAPLDRVDLFERQANGIFAMQRSGDHVRHDAWPRATLMPSFMLAPGMEHELYLRIEDASLQAPIVLRSVENASANERFEDLIAAAYFAIALALALYNFLLFAGTGLRIYGTYVVYVFAFALFLTTMNGVGAALLWPSSPFLSDRTPVFFATIALLALAQLLVELLGLEGRDDAVASFARRVRPLLLGLGAITIVAPFPWALALLSVLAIAGVGVTIVVAGVDAASGSRPAKLFLVAFAALLIAVVALAISNAGLVELGSATLLMLPVGSALELILLAFALADRIKALQHEATHQAMRAQEFAEAAKQSAELALEEQARTNRELERLAALKDAFLANTSHELRTPLNGILGLTEVTLSGSVGALPSGASRNLAIIRSSARRLGSLVNDILDFSKMREKGLTLRLEAVRLHDAVGAVMAMLEPLAADKNLRMVSEVDDALWCLADAGRLQQILTNLVGNAIKFTYDGSVVVQARRRSGRVHVAVVDTGVGIPETSFGRIFESFEQGDGSASRDHGGTGLGLAVTRRLVELHGGSVVVMSEVGRGSTFSFDLEATEASAGDERLSHVARDDDAPRPSQQNAEPRIVSPLPALAGHALRVFVVDDEPTNRDVLAQHLGSRGFTVELFSGGHAVLERFRDATSPEPDLMLLDVMMPGCTGYDVLEALRPLRPLEALPILLLTAKAREADLARGYALGASDYLLKPLSFVELDARLAHHAKLVLSTRAERQELDARRTLQGALATTEAKLADSQALATLGTLVAGIAHDLRNPLQFVMAAVEQLRDATPNVMSEHEADRAAASTMITRATEWVETGANKMEALSRAMRNQSRSDHEHTLVPLAEAVEEAWLLCRGRAADATVTFEVRDSSVLIDPVGFGQLVMNLISNAADALHEHGVHPSRRDHETKRIHVEGHVDDGILTLRVHDNGPGVPVELRDRIREAFFTTKPRGQGTGLGLAIVCRVAEEHGGTVAVETSPILAGALFEVRWRNGGRART